MVLLDNVLDIFCDHAAVVNEDPDSLQKEVEIVRKECGPWVRVRGFTDFKELFLALHVARVKKRPFSLAFIRETTEEAGSLVLKKTDPFLKTIKYSDSQILVTMIPSHR